LLLPYFEVDLADPGGFTTLFSINNAFDSPALAHVTLWTDYARPTLRFDVYLTGYDVQTINVRDLFNGFLPATATASHDPTDSISPGGPLSEDGDFPECPIEFEPSAVVGETLIRAHQGLDASSYGGCVGFPHGDGRARGYITVDSVSRCSLLAPSDAGYFSEVAATANVLWGTYFFLDPANNSAQQETLVHIEACTPSPLSVPPPGTCEFAPDAYTFYGRYVTDAADQREPLPSTFALAYLNGAAFNGGTRLTVWRDTKREPDTSGQCGAFRPPWFPLSSRDVVSFDEQETPTDQCHGPIADPPPPVSGCFPLASQAVRLGEAAVAGGEAVLPPSDFGWLFLNLTHERSGDPFPGRAQAWVTTLLSASGRFSVATDAVALDDLCSPDAGQQLLF
jgi:hypothetical protein